MANFQDIQMLVQKGIKSTDSMMKFYTGINELLESLQKNNLNNVSISFTLQDLITYFPNSDANTLQHFLKKQCIKKYTEGEKTYYTLSEILSCFDFLFQSIGACK